MTDRREEPATEAGRALLLAANADAELAYRYESLVQAILAIEGEAQGEQPAPLNVEVYTDRNLVVQAFAQAMEHESYAVWWGIDEAEPDWPVLYVETDEGQVSWHIPASERLYEPPVRPEHGPLRKWDGHTTPEKFNRLRVRLSEQPSTEPAQGEER